MKKAKRRQTASFDNIRQITIYHSRLHIFRILKETYRNIFFFIRIIAAITIARMDKASGNQK